jgi:hypothetical protein
LNFWQKRRHEKKKILADQKDLGFTNCPNQSSSSEKGEE